MDRDSIWTRRSRPSLNSSQSESRENKSESRTFSSSKRFPGIDTAGATRQGGANGTGAPSSSSITSPGASSAFGLGSGAFASFGATAAATKTPKTAGNAFDFGKVASAAENNSSESEKQGKNTAIASAVTGQPTASQSPEETPDLDSAWPLKYSWVMWYRPPTSKNSDYEKSIKPLYKMTSAQEFWKIYTHLKHPSSLPIVSDYHFFKDGIRPVWEDEENKRGGKWIIRLKKGVIDRYWDDMLLAVIGDQFVEAGEEVCGMVVSVRNGEDVLSVWTKNDGGRNVKIRETIKRVLGLPADTNIVWKSHDDSIAQRSAIDQARQEKGVAEKRRNTLTISDSTSLAKEKP